MGEEDKCSRRRSERLSNFAQPASYCTFKGNAVPGREAKRRCCRTIQVKVHEDDLGALKQFPRVACVISVELVRIPQCFNVRRPTPSRRVSMTVSGSSSM